MLTVDTSTDTMLDTNTHHATLDTRWKYIIRVGISGKMCMHTDVDVLQCKT